MEIFNDLRREWTISEWRHTYSTFDTLNKIQRKTYMYDIKHKTMLEVFM